LNITDSEISTGNGADMNLVLKSPPRHKGGKKGE